MPETTEAKVSSRVWLFRILAAAAGGLMLISWFMPWWTSDIEALGADIMRIRPWGIELTRDLGGFEILLKGTEMPPWFAPAMWAYIAACMLALLIGIFLVGKELHIGRINLARLVSIGKFRISLSQVLIGGVGLSYIVAGVVFAVYTSKRMADAYDIPLQGRVLVDLGEPIITFIDTMLLPGYYLVFVAAMLLVVLALLQDLIIGASKPSTQPGSKGAQAMGHSRA